MSEVKTLAEELCIKDSSQLLPFALIYFKGYKGYHQPPNLSNDQHVPATNAGNGQSTSSIPLPTQQQHQHSGFVHPPSINESKQANDNTVEDADMKAMLAKAEATQPLGKPTIDLCFVMDCTGSMAPAIDAARAKIQEIIQYVRDEFRGLGAFNIAIVGYRDYGDTPQHEVYTDPLSSV
jgi:hypothetical protein